MKISQKTQFFFTFWELSRSIIHIIKKTLDDFWSTFDVLFNGSNGVTLISMASLSFAKKHEKCWFFLSRFDSFRDIIFSSKLNLAQVDTNHVWKNQLSSFYGLVTIIQNVDFYSFSCVVFEISFFPSFARTSSSNLHCRWHI